MNYLTIKSFYVFSIAVILISILYIIYITIIYPTLRKNIIKKRLFQSALSFNKQVIVSKSKVDGATFKIKIDNKNYLAKVIYVPNNCDLQINNIDTFVVYKKATQDTYKHKILHGMTLFMNSKHPNKIILLAKKAKTIKKVINECEMIMVNSKTDVYGTNIYNFNDYSTLFINEND